MTLYLMSIVMNTLPSAQHPARQAARGAVAWSLWLFALNLVWEFAQLPLYAISPEVNWPVLVYAVFHCTLGDATVALFTYLLAALLTRHPLWPMGRPLIGLAVILVAGETFTVWAEWYNVYVLRSWAYAAGMPTIRGIGVAPLVQWLVLPVLAVAIFRYTHRHGFEVKVFSLTRHEPTRRNHR